MRCASYGVTGWIYAMDTAGSGDMTHFDSRVEKGKQCIEGELEPRSGLDQLRERLCCRRAGQCGRPHKEMCDGRSDGIP